MRDGCVEVEGVVAGHGEVGGAGALEWSGRGMFV